MSNALFPFPRSTGALPGISWDITRAPAFATKTQQVVGGNEYAIAFQPYPIWHWTLTYDFLRTYTPQGGSPFTEWQTLVGFFTARQGSFDTFLFDDPEDDTATAQLVGTGDGSNKVFQLGRTLGLFEPIYNVQGTPTPQVFLNGTLQVSGYTISGGTLTFTAAPGAGVLVTWTGKFYWRCRFEQDTTQFGMLASGFWDAKSITIRSVLGA